MMTTDQSSKQAIELDKMELPRPAQRPQTTGAKTQPPAPHNTKPALAKQRLAVALFSVLLVLTIGLALLIAKPSQLNWSFFSQHPKQSTLDLYARIGPLTTSAGQSSKLKLLLDVKCKHATAKEQLTQMETAISNQLLLALTRPEAQKCIQNRDFGALKSVIRSQIETILPQAAIEDVYFSDLLIY